jgi:hypothetical protein
MCPFYLTAVVALRRNLRSVAVLCLSIAGRTFGSFSGPRGLWLTSSGKLPARGAIAVERSQTGSKGAFQPSRPLPEAPDLSTTERALRV